MGPDNGRGGEKDREALTTSGPTDKATNRESLGPLQHFKAVFDEKT